MADEIKITSNFTEILAEVRKAMQGFAAESGATKAEMRTITSMAKQLMKQQESALRVANRSGQIHEARLKEIERHAQMVQSNLRVRAALRDDSGGGGGISMGGMGIPFGKQMDEIKDLLQKTVGFGKGGMAGNIYQYQQEQKSLSGAGKVGTSSPLAGLATKTGQATKQLGNFSKRISARFGGFIDKAGGMMKDNQKVAAAGAAGGMAGGIIGMIIKKAIEASPMLQAMLKIVNMAVLLWLRPIGDFFGFMFKPIAMYLLRQSIMGLENIGEMQKMGSDVGKKILAFFLDPGKYISEGLLATFSPNPDVFMEKTVLPIIEDAYKKLDDFTKGMTRGQKPTAGGNVYSIAIPPELTGLLVGMEAKYGAYSEEINKWLSRAVPIFEDFAIVVPEELLNAWDYYQNIVDEGGMSIKTAMDRMKTLTSYYTEAGTGIMAGVLVYTQKYMDTVQTAGGDYATMLEEAQDRFAGIFATFNIDMGGELDDIVTNTKTTGQIFIENLGKAWEDFITNLREQFTGMTLGAKGTGNVLDDFFAWINSVFGIDPGYKGGTTGKGGQGDAHAHADKIAKIETEIATTAATLAEQGQNSQQIQSYITNTLTTAAMKPSATAAEIDAAVSFLKGETDMTKYFGEGAHYGDIGGTYGYNYESLNLTVEKVQTQLDSMAAKDAKVENAILSIAQNDPNYPANQLKALAEAVKSGDTAEYKKLVESGMTAVEAIAVAAGTSGAPVVTVNDDGTVSVSPGNSGTTPGTSPGTPGTSPGTSPPASTPPASTPPSPPPSKPPPSKRPPRRAMGGWLTEEIHGVGLETGSGYIMGEHGDEFITPAHAMGNANGGGGININFYIEKVAKEIDLEDLKTKVERAILEVHSRRGII